ncbi:hypothetical protein LCGC14_2667480, partial [marine sediment metagenome]
MAREEANRRREQRIAFGFFVSAPTLFAFVLKSWCECHANLRVHEHEYNTQLDSGATDRKLDAEFRLLQQYQAGTASFSLETAKARAAFHEAYAKSVLAFGLPPESVTTAWELIITGVSPKVEAVAGWKALTITDCMNQYNELLS